MSLAALLRPAASLTALSVVNSLLVLLLVTASYFPPTPKTPNICPLFLNMSRECKQKQKQKQIKARRRQCPPMPLLLMPKPPIHPSTQKGGGAPFTGGSTGHLAVQTHPICPSLPSRSRSASNVPAAVPVPPACPGIRAVRNRSSRRQLPLCPQMGYGHP